MSNLNLIEMEKQRRALYFISNLENMESKDEKIKLFVDMMTYYDETNARDFQLFCMDILIDSSTYSRDCKLKDKIIELENIKNNKEGT